MASVVRTDFPRSEQVDRDDVMVGLLAALLPRHPAAAMRLLYDTVVADWPTAMAQLETGAPALVDLLGVRAADAELPEMTRIRLATQEAARRTRG